MVGSVLKRGVVSALALVGAMSLSAAPARSDTVTAYAAVVCQGSQALVRFTWAENQDRPDFSPNESRLATPLWRLPSQDPSRCRLQDGREVVLRQVSGDDQRAHGYCGGQTTEFFSLSVGGKRLYANETWHHRCDSPFSIQAILLRGTSLTECRLVRKRSHDTEARALCVDQSARLRRAAAAPIETPGSLVLLRAAPGRTAFCRSLPFRPTRSRRDGVPWPSYPQEPEQILPELELPERQEEPPPEGELSEAEMMQELKKWFESVANSKTLVDGMESLEDVYGDGEKRRVFKIERDSGGFRASYWVVLPASASEAEVDALHKELLWGENIPEARAKGVRIIAGDLTSYGETNRVWITPFRRDRRIWFHASRTYFDENAPQHPSDLVLRATPGGEAEEVCAFRRAPRI